MAEADAQVITQDLIRLDLRFAMALMERARESENYPLTFMHVSRLSMIAFELRKRAKTSTADGAVATFVFEDELGSSRQSAKLLKDTKKPLESQLLEFAEQAVRQRRWYVRNNRVGHLLDRIPLAARWLVDDTSLILFRGGVVSTSQAVEFATGLGPTSQEQETVARFAEVSGFLASEFQAACPGEEPQLLMPTWSGSEVVLKDAMFAQLYGQMFPGFPEEVGLALGVLLTEFNSLTLLREFTPPEDLLYSATAKQRFSGARHLLESFGEVGHWLTRHSEVESGVAGLFGDEAVGKVMSDGGRHLRNAFVHYGVDPRHAVVSPDREPALGLVQAHGFGPTWSDLDAAVSDALTQIGRFFDLALGDFSGALHEPHE